MELKNWIVVAILLEVACGLALVVGIAVGISWIFGLSSDKQKAQATAQCYEDYPDPRAAERKVCLDMVKKRY